MAWTTSGHLFTAEAVGECRHACTHAPTYVDQPGLGYGLPPVLDGLVMVSVAMDMCGWLSSARSVKVSHHGAIPRFVSEEELLGGFTPDIHRAR